MDTCGQGCGDPIYAKGLCKRHYNHQYNVANKARRRQQARARYAAKRKQIREQQRLAYQADPESYKARSRRWREEHPEQKRATNRQYREQNLGRLREYDAQPERMAKKAAHKRERYEDLKREALLVYGDGSCADCGYRPDDLFELEIHHVNHDGVEHRTQLTGSRRGHTFQFYQALKEAGWPTDVPLETLCARCHKKKTRAQQMASV